MPSSASTWYYASGDAPAGPRTLEEMRVLMASGELTAETLVWTQGLVEWVPAQQLPVLLLPPEPVAAPAPAPGVAEAPPEKRHIPAAAHAWSRWLARMLDIGFFAVLLSTAIVLVSTATGSPPPTIDPGRPNLLVALIPVLWIPIEAILIATAGTTPGKALLNLRVETTAGGPPPFTVALSRAARVWVQGMGLSIPFVIFIAEAIGYTRLTRTGSTPWDDALSLRVAQGAIGPGRSLILAGLIMLFALALGTFLQQAAAG